MEVALVAVWCWPPSWTGCFPERTAVRTAYQLLNREVDVFVRQICFGDGSSAISWESGRPGMCILTRIKNKLRPQGKSQQQISNLSTVKKGIKMVTPCEDRENQRRNWRKKSTLALAVPKRNSSFSILIYRCSWWRTILKECRKQMNEKEDEMEEVTAPFC